MPVRAPRSSQASVRLERKERGLYLCRLAVAQWLTEIHDDRFQGSSTEQASAPTANPRERDKLWCGAKLTQIK